MSIESDWQAIEAELQHRSPQILADLRPPITESELARWSSLVGQLPAGLRALYRRHAGTTTYGAGGFCFIGNWYPLTVEQALTRYVECRQMTDLWQREALIPFAVDLSGSHLGLYPGDGSTELQLMFDDTPDIPYEAFHDLDSLVSSTLDGLQDNNPLYRPELTSQDLTWIDLEEEADDLDL